MTNHKTTLYNYYGASPHFYVFILPWSEPSTRWISHRHARSHVPLDLRCFNGPAYELDLRSWYWFRAVATRLRSVWWWCCV
ncbi:hypothetical protein GQ53DRAFT_751297 [Thozetella sp. PMI_491]|nr:hypothetical protein GQ53DRAFT_751297 [Thozetella sp. PMI_491]